ncbi:MAG: hypothetical protein ACKO1F_10300, partial [Flammeovirgaceae bacterium]
MAGLQKEIWIDEFKEGFYSQYGWFEKITDWSKYVEFNTINFAAIGPDPVVTKNSNATITSAQRVDIALSVTLDWYDTNTTFVVWTREEIEGAYDKL